MNYAVALSDCALIAERVIIIVTDVDIVSRTINHSSSFDGVDQNGLQTRGFGKNTQQSNSIVA